MYSNSTDYDKVKTEFTGPMMRMYNPPGHIRDDTQAVREMLAEYTKTLNRYDAETLRKAWEKVKSEHATWIWPHIAVIRQACETFKPVRGGSTGEPGKHDSPYEKRDEAIAEEAGKFAMDWVENSPMSGEAMREGWHISLVCYARRLAHAQRWLLEYGRTGFTTLEWTMDPDRQNQLKRILWEAKTLGAMNISVPVWLIEDWKRSAAYKIKQKAKAA